ncbi:MAG: S8 family serine peptidase, partial [Lewinella sp.]|nr:S8 family serine peptidase [Lewinella sp.]
MKTTVCLATLLLTLFLCPNLTFAQLGGYGGGNNADTWADKNYPENQLLVAYLPGTTTEEKQAVRGFYSITDVEEVNNELELWYEISFPIEVQEEQNGAPHTVTLYDVEELLANLDVQNNSTSNHDDARAQVNSGDFNYELNLLEINPSYYSGPMQILPDCREDAHRFSGPAGPFSSGEISVVVMDQAFNFMNATMTGNIRVIDGPLGGGNISLASHADQIGFIIQQSLATANLDVTFFNVAIFDPSGESSYADLIQGFKWLKDNSIQNCVINLSASMTVESSVFSQPIWNYIDNIITNQNLLLVSSAGNDGYGDDTIVLPGCAGMPHEITVAGTSACFSAPWSLSNSNTVSFEIAAEAEQVLVPIST